MQVDYNKSREILQRIVTEFENVGDDKEKICFSEYDFDRHGGPHIEYKHKLSAVTIDEGYEYNTLNNTKKLGGEEQIVADELFREKMSKKENKKALMKELLENKTDAFYYETFYIEKSDISLVDDKFNMSAFVGNIYGSDFSYLEFEYDKDLKIWIDYGSDDEYPLRYICALDFSNYSFVT